MQKRQFDSIVKDLLAHETKLREDKTSDYGRTEDIFDSVHEIARNFNLSVPKVIGMLLHKHIAAIYKAIRSNDLEPKCHAEPLTQRIMDARAYLLLLLAHLEDEPEIKIAPQYDAVINPKKFESSFTNTTR